MNTIKKTLYDGYKAAAEMVIPDLKDSNFLETGMLTRDEFKLSGDLLIKNDPSWVWTKPGLCLLKKRILCNKADLEQDLNETDDINVYNFRNAAHETRKTRVTNDNTDAAGDAGDAGDAAGDDDDLLAAFENDDLIEQDCGIIQPKYVDTQHYYNVSITYDQYYRTPRIWFEGMNGYNEVLSQDEIYSDFMVEYIKVSLTLETHPILNINCISVHPCKHAFAMQKMFAFELEKKDATDVKIEDYLVHFLKFASCVIPQLEFDKSSV